jgi:hypothetical protein
MEARVTVPRVSVAADGRRWNDALLARDYRLRFFIHRSA